MKSQAHTIGELREIQFLDDKNELIIRPQVSILYSTIEERKSEPKYAARICASVYNLFVDNVSKEDKDEFTKNFDSFFNQYKNLEHHIIKHDEEQENKI